MPSSRKTHNKRGMAAVEMALMLPIFLILLVGVMDAARLYWTQNVVRDAAFEGARMAILHEPTTEQIETVVLEEIVSGGLDNNVAVTIGLREAAQPVDVTVTVPFEFFIIGNIIPSLGGNKPISATAVMTHER